MLYISDKMKPTKKYKKAGTKNKIVQENTLITELVDPVKFPVALMPELDELVKKNPNRLLGCGG
ncbi:MAG TPA: hypothetical protein PKO18_03485 [Chitinophagales bacterium]|nr:hypothetical protein [Chitinophagales bacterium]HNL84275.1 hypothetical protein [Chitinophagales bacterium]